MLINRKIILGNKEFIYQISIDKYSIMVVKKGQKITFYNVPAFPQEGAGKREKSNKVFRIIIKEVVDFLAENKIIVINDFDENKHCGSKNNCSLIFDELILNAIRSPVLVKIENDIVKELEIWKKKHLVSPASKELQEKENQLRMDKYTNYANIYGEKEIAGTISVSYKLIRNNKNHPELKVIIKNLTEENEYIKKNIKKRFIPGVQGLPFMEKLPSITGLGKLGLFAAKGLMQEFKGKLAFKFLRTPKGGAYRFILTFRDFSDRSIFPEDTYR